MKSDVLFFVEDPGALNFIGRFPFLLREKDYSVHMIASDLAGEFLRSRHQEFEEIGGRDASALLERFRPRVLVVGTSENKDSLAFPLVIEARERGVLSVGVIDAEMNAAYRFRGHTDDPMAFVPDWLMVPSLKTREVYEELGVLAHRIFVSGHPHHDSVLSRAEALEREGVEGVRKRIFLKEWKERKIVSFMAEISGGLDEGGYQRTEDYRLFGRGERDGRTEIVMEEFLDAIQEIHPRPYLVLRPHPRNRPGDFGGLENEFDEVLWEGSSIEISFASDAVVGMTSMALVEAYVLGRPTLSVLPREEEKTWLSLIFNEEIPCVTKQEEFASAFENIFVLSKQDPCSSRRMSSEGADEKAVSFLERMLKFSKDREKK